MKPGRNKGRSPRDAKRPRRHRAVEGPPGIPKDLLPPPAPGIDWNKVWRAAWTSATEAEIVAGHSIPAASLAPPEVLQAFRNVVVTGNACGLLHLKDLIARRSMKTRRSDGSSYVLALRARNEADYDQQLASQETEPDLGTAKARLRELIIKLSAVRSEIEGRTVSPLELFAREAELIEAASDVPRKDDGAADPAKDAKAAAAKKKGDQ